MSNVETSLRNLWFCMGFLIGTLFFEAENQGVLTLAHTLNQLAKSPVLTSFCFKTSCTFLKSYDTAPGYNTKKPLLANGCMGW